MALKVGDEVLWLSRGGTTHYYEIKRIERETKTQWILNSDERFYKESLREFGRNFGASIKELTNENRLIFEEWKDEQTHQQLWRQIRDIKRPYHLSASDLMEIYNKLVGDTNESK